MSLLAVLIAAMGLAQESVRAPSQRTAIAHVTVVDVVSGALLKDQTVIVDGTRIASVARGAAIPADARVIAGGGKYLIPGLWDMHVHATHAGRAPYYWPLFVAFGVTGVRNMGSYLDSTLYWRAVRDTLHEAAPRIVWSSPIVDGLATYRHAIVVRTPSEARAVVDSMRRLRFDLVKVYGHLTRETYFAIADEARRIGMPFAGHVPYRVTPVEAAAAGQGSIEHLENEVEFCTPGLMEANAVFDSAGVIGARPPPGLAKRVAQLVSVGYDTPRCAAMAQALREHGTWQTPTLVANRAYFDLSDAWLLSPNDMRRRFEPPAVTAGWDSSRAQALRNMPPFVVAAQHAFFESRTRLTGELHRAGVGILAGTDVADLYGVFPGWSLHEELELLHASGMSPLDALRSATINPARYLHATDSLGSIATGKLADLVLLDANPLENITNTWRIRGVFANGQYLDRTALDSLMHLAERRAAGAK